MSKEFLDSRKSAKRVAELAPTPKRPVTNAFPSMLDYAMVLSRGTSIDEGESGHSEEETVVAWQVIS